MRAGSGGGSGNADIQNRMMADRRQKEEAERARLAAEQAAQFNIVRDQSQQGWAAAMNAANRQHQAGQIAEDPAQAHLRAIGTGQAPTYAGAQLRANLAGAQQQALGVAAGARGAQRGAERMQVLQNFGALGGQAGHQAAALDSQERLGAAGASSQLGLQRAISQEGANRGAFDSTTGAQLGGLQAAQGMGGLGLQGTLGSVQTQQFQQQMEMERKRQEQARAMAWLSFITGAGQTVATAYGRPTPKVG